MRIPWTRELKSVPDIAYGHHEKLNGTGYPYQHKGDAISRPARILAAADAFQALAQNRPYRHSLELDTILTILKAMIEEGKLDPEIYTIIAEHAEECHHIALADTS